MEDNTRAELRAEKLITIDILTFLNEKYKSYNHLNITIISFK